MSGNRISVHDIIFAEVPFVEKEGEKYRPALVLSIDGERIQVYKITSKYQEKSDVIKGRYFEIVDLAIAGLRRQSWIDTINIIPLKEKTKIRFSGRLSRRDYVRFIDFLKNLD